ncbi:glycosyltransferase family 2 protein [Candidatus Falkowbacteria bacterium]|nr:glycosyltransferase family 2 protein [Candidatus Falkowbacteria bacterium]
MIKKIAIILAPNWRDYAERYLADCVRAIRAQDWTGEYKIFLTDNSSTPESVAFIRQTAPEIDLITNAANDGFCKGNNDALRRAMQQGFEYFVLLNMDTEVAPDWLRQLVSAADRLNSWGAVQSRLMLFDDKTKINSLGNDLHYLGFGFSHGEGQEWEIRNRKLEIGNSPRFAGEAGGQGEGNNEVTYFSGAAVLLRKDVLDAVGLFDEEFWMYHEDLDLSWRIRLAGYPLCLAPDSVAYHKYQFAKSIRQYYWMERNRAICLLTLYRWPTILLIYPMWLVMDAALLLFAIKNGFWWEKIKACCWLMLPTTWVYLTKRRQQIKKLRRVGDREIVRLFVAEIKFQPVDNWLLRRVGNPVMRLYWRVVLPLIIW